MKKKFIVGAVSVCAAAAISLSAVALAASSGNSGGEPVAAKEEPVTTMSQMKTRVANDRSLTKQNLYHKMLNSVDYYQTASGAFEAPDLGISDSTVEYQVDIPNQVSYQRITDAGADEESYALNGMKTTYNNKERTYRQEGLPVYAENLEEVRSMDRMTQEGDGAWHCVLRGDLTNTGIAASLSLLPQQLAFGFLGEFDKWDIKGTESFLGREAVRIEGVTDQNYEDKLGVTNFVFLVDRDTGILLNYDGYSADGKRVDYMHTKRIAVDQGIDQSLFSRMDRYAEYTQQ